VKVKLHGNRVLITVIIAALLAVTGSNCRPSSTPSPESEHEREMPELSAVTLGAGEKLQVVATTNVLADVVGIVGGDRIALTALMGVGVDPHSYAPTPADVAAVHNAHVVFASGAGLETNLEEMLDSAGGEAAHIYVSQGLELRPVPDESSGEEEAAHDHEDGDPHVWFSVPNVIAWVGTIESTLSALDPANAAVYAANARAYVEELEALDAWVMEQVATIPEANRRLVTSHPAFGYLADRYGLELVGAVYPVSPSSEPSAQDLAALEEAIRAYGVPAIFTESTVNPKLAEQVAQDTGVRLVPLYTGSLGGPGSGVESYVELMRYDVEAIVGALK
jgi:ABC-type Zn uptake system ZnuABC Zn-binding protein ZnuA